jgi:Fic family protein
MAQQGELDANDTRRDLQLEARAHIRVQREIDARFSSGSLGEPASIDLIRWIHRTFYEDASERMLRIEHQAGAFKLVPGEFRAEAKHDVAVGRHQPPSSHRVGAFMEYFEQRYRFESLGTPARIVAMAAAHHRLNDIHPFVDGNGRVSRLMSHAMALFAGIGAHGLWSISRGLARGLDDAGEYKRMMDAADAPRRGDFDGRGNLSQEALIEFVTWFCRVAFDQLRFMQGLFDLGTLGERLQAYVHEALGGGDAASALASEVLRAEKQNAFHGLVTRLQPALPADRSPHRFRRAMTAAVRRPALARARACRPIRASHCSPASPCPAPTCRGRRR